ncbi:MAG TPA: TetR family transcriptional regulator [Pirellulales bacterium]|nr:TetR family transcriptional regulator [Pirellulales bacterium]
MRKSKQETAETRERIVATAAAEFRRQGILATGLADLMSAAGLTHGGFYRHFDSKEQLVTEACAAALASTTEGLQGAAAGKPKREALRAIVARYLSVPHRDHPQAGCAFAAIGSELARADKKTRAVATESFEGLVRLLAAGFDDLAPAEAEQQAQVAAATMIGALLMSRIVSDPELSRSILRNAQAAINEL